MDSAQYISTRGSLSPVDFETAVMMGLADDGGLLLPVEVPDCRGMLSAWSGLSYVELAAAVMRPFVGSGIADAEWRALVSRSYARFAHPEVIPLVPLEPGLYVAELFHGPTLAFKDVALQFLGEVFAHVLGRRGGCLNIIGATSGDTGSAAIHGVRGKRGINIFIMYPEGRVSPLQELQMATVPDANVHCLAIRGTFDDGQRVLKEIFNDLPFKSAYSLGAVNSVNWARILAQMVYYFWVAFRVQEREGHRNPIQVSVPTGNFGDIFAGYMARRMGAPVSRLVLATNENDILSRFFHSGEYSLGEVSPTLSPSMDIQVASNFERYLYYRVGQDPQRVRSLMAEFGRSGRLRLEGSDPGIAAGRGDTAETLATIRQVAAAADYILDPHTAVGVAVARRLPLAGASTVCLGTAHPGKFPAAIEEALGESGRALHPSLEALRGLPLRKVILSPEKGVIEDYVRRALGGNEVMARLG